MAHNHMTLEMPSLSENVGLARVAVAAFAGQLPFSLAELEEIKVAVSEAVSNCVIHAYGDDVGPIRVHATLADDWLSIEVQDWGRGIADVDQARQAAFTSSTDPDHLGLGFTFMENFMDKVDVSSKVGEGTTVRLGKRAPDPAAVRS